MLLLVAFCPPPPSNFRIYFELTIVWPLAAFVCAGREYFDINFVSCDSNAGAGYFGLEQGTLDWIMWLLQVYVGKSLFR